MIIHWFQVIETRFLDVVIDVLSRSLLVRACFSGTVDLFIRREAMLTALLLIFCSLFGALSGCVFFVVFLAGH